MIPTYYKSPNNDFLLAHGDCFKLLEEFDFKFDMIFADPPYFLSNGGISLQSGKVVCVDKGDWDKGKSQEDMMAFNMEWLRLCRDKLKDNGTIWISGTYHNIFSVANCLTELGYKILNVITWEKTNPPVNISCRFFKYSTEFVIWARKEQKVPHKFNYGLMKELNDGKQMTDVWRLPAIGRWEKTCGKHPTQKPLRLLVRMILASTNPGDWILDPFSGSSTTGIAANLCGRRFAGIEQEEEFCRMSKERREEMENIENYGNLISHIEDLQSWKAARWRMTKQMLLRNSLFSLRAEEEKSVLKAIWGLTPPAKVQLILKHPRKWSKQECFFLLKIVILLCNYKNNVIFA